MGKQKFMEFAKSHKSKQNTWILIQNQIEIKRWINQLKTKICSQSVH